MINIFKALLQTQKRISNNSQLFKTLFNSQQFKIGQFNGLTYLANSKFSSNFGESDLKNLSQTLQQYSNRQQGNSIFEVAQKVENIKFNLTKIDLALVQEFHKRLVEYYTNQKNLSTEEESKKICNALILQEQTQLYYAYEELEYSDEVVSACESLADLFNQVKNDLIFQSPQIEFDYYFSLSQIFGSHKKDDCTFEVFKLIEERTPKEIKQINYERYIESQCERVTLSQLTRNHDQVFFHLDILFRECENLQIPKDNNKILSKINSFFLRAILLSSQFDKTEKEGNYQQQQKNFIAKYQYQPSTIEQLTVQVKEISAKTPNYIQVKGEQVTSFIEAHKLEFSSQVQDILIYQLYNQVVPLNLFEYFYMLVKFESNYREEIEEIPLLLKDSPDELVDDFEELIVSNISTLLEIRRLIKLFTEEVIEIKVNDPFPQLEISSWISHIEPKYQQRVKDAFKKQEQTYL